MTLFLIWSLGIMAATPAVIFLESALSEDGDDVVSGPRFLATTLLWPLAIPAYLWSFKKKAAADREKAVMKELQPHLDEIEEYLRRNR